MLRKLLVAASLLLAGPALAQSVQQSGTVTRAHIPYWVTSGVIGDGGSSADSPISSIGVTNNGGSGICVNSARQTAAGYNALCLGASTTGPATISLQNFGTAAAQSLQFVINGTTYSFPGSLANITIGVTPVVGGTNSNCLFVSGGVVGQQACTLSAITALTGDATATGPGSSVLTLATVNSNVGTFGSGAVVPIVTVNGKGLITAVSTSPVSITVGSSAIVSGSNNGILYDNGGVFGNLSTLASAVLITSAGGVPSLSATLPSALTIPTPTFTGTLTLPDAATWTSTGISKVAALSVGSATLPSGGNISISGQYQVNGTQIAASNLSNGTTGSGAVVLAAGPTISGTWAGSATFSGALTLSGNDTFSAQAIHTGTSAPASAAGNTVVMGTIASPTLTNTGQAFLYNTTVNGAILEGDGSTNDVSVFNKSGALVFGVPTGTTKLNFPSLSSGTCSSGLALDSSNNTVLVSCPGAAASVQVGTTAVNSGTTGFLLYNNVGTLGNETIASILTAGNGISITGTTNATIAQSLTNTSFSTAVATPSGSNSASAVMMGAGVSNCKLTPAYSTRVSIAFTISASNAGASIGGVYSLRFGTGAAPANGAAATGTIVSGPFTYSEVGGNTNAIPLTAVITGLTPSTAYWFDFAQTSNGAATITPSYGCSGFEF